MLKIHITKCKCHNPHKVSYLKLFSMQLYNSHLWVEVSVRKYTLIDSAAAGGGRYSKTPIKAKMKWWRFLLSVMNMHVIDCECHCVIIAVLDLRIKQNTP